jgi:hypothetical protein
LDASKQVGMAMHSHHACCRHRARTLQRLAAYLQVQQQHWATALLPLCLLSKERALWKMRLYRHKHSLRQQPAAHC